MTQPGVAVHIHGLEEKYRVNEPIEFSVDIKGTLRGGGFPHVTITKENNPKNKIYSMSFMSPVEPSLAAAHVEQSLHFPGENDPQAPIHAKEAGTYILTVTLTLDGLKPYQVSRRIRVE